MKKGLPARPHLDHLRRQAKVLLQSLERGDAEAIATIVAHLPAARGMTPAQVRSSHFRLADAQSAIARKTGFAGWPHLSRHVEQLRALEGTWKFARLEIDGSAIPAAALAASRVLIDGDRFRTESPEGTYEGVFNINVEPQPHEIDIEFVQGPEAGNSNFGIFRLQGDQLELCLDLNGNPRPNAFRTSGGSGHAYETLTRTSQARPENLTGGTRARNAQGASTLGFAAPPTPTQDPAAFDFLDSPTVAALQGQWTAVKIVRDGQELPSMMLRVALRSATKNEVTISFGGRVMIHALVKLDESHDPIHIDYYNLEGDAKGQIQHGLLKWIGDDVCFCMAAPGQPRPSDFNCPPGSGYTQSQWRLKK